MQREHSMYRSPLPSFVLVVRQLGVPTDLASGSVDYRPNVYGCLTGIEDSAGYLFIFQIA